MRRLAGVACCCIFILLAVSQGMGCGDKVLALGRAVKLRYVSTHSASILLYLHSGARAAPAMSDASLQSALKKSSQVLKIVNDAAELEQALIATGLVLFVITFLVNAVARAVVVRSTRRRLA